MWIKTAATANSTPLAITYEALEGYIDSVRFTPSLLTSSIKFYIATEPEETADPQKRKFAGLLP